MGFAFVVDALLAGIELGEFLVAVRKKYALLEMRDKAPDCCYFCDREGGCYLYFTGAQREWVLS